MSPRELCKLCKDLLADGHFHVVRSAETCLEAVVALLQGANEEHKAYTRGSVSWLCLGKLVHTHDVKHKARETVSNGVTKIRFKLTL